MECLEGYTWPRPEGFQPFDHQKETAEFLVTNRKAFCFNEQGTGKTASVIWATDHLMNLGLVRRVLVVCPLSIMHSAWQLDLFKFAIHRKVAVAYGASAKRKQIIASGAEYTIINFDGMQIVKDEIINGGFDLIVIDEASAMKNVQTDRWKTLRDICKHVKGLWMLTGTPAAQSPVDAFGLAKLVNPKGVPQFFGAFRDMVMTPGGPYRWIPKPGAKDIVHKILQPAIRFEKSQCLDLPAVTHVDREAPMSPQQVKYYKQLKSDRLITAGTEEITSVNAAVLLTKLLQLACGAVYTSTGEVMEFDVKSRLHAIKEVIEEATDKVIVFVPFTHVIQMVYEYLTKAGITCEILNGAVSVPRRNAIVADFQGKHNPRVLIVQPKAASHGLTLTAANTIIWYAPVTSVETYLQGNARIDRPGQRNPMTIVHIKGSPVEDKLYKMLRNNISNHAQIVDLYRQELADTA